MGPKGIRQKITVGFYFLVLCIMAIAGLTYGIVNEVGKKIESLEIVDDFLNMTLEVRRFEKNISWIIQYYCPGSWVKAAITISGAKFTATRKVSNGCTVSISAVQRLISLKKTASK